jgi:methyl-accepting chemotaxis protein
MKLGTKLLVTIICLMLVPLISIGILSMNIIDNGIEGQAQLKINGDIGGAREIYQGMEDKLRIIASSLSEKERIRTEIYNSSNSKSIELIQSVKKRYPYISSIIITDLSGNVVARSNSDKIGNNLASDPFVTAALNGEEIAGSAIIPEEELALDKLDSQAKIELIQTENAMPSDKKVETKGMMIKAGSPIMIDGKIMGSVVIGHLINKDNTIVDETASAVNVETSTIFMNDVRISTNVKEQDGKRAIGTRISIPVYNAVLQNENKFFGRAFVVNDWYITAYEPIYDINHKVIGVLYVGTPEAPFVEIKKEAQQNLLLIGGMTLLISILLGIYVSRKLVKPMDSMYRASDKVATVAQGLTTSVEEINTTIEQISSTTQGISTGANQHSLMMVEISKASKEMLESVQHVAADSQKAAEIADGADKTAKEIKILSQELFRLMNEIKKAVGNSSEIIMELDTESQKIGETTGLITKIAYQTNMLALNASIEAARAGEHGKGFAVVADEVRKLAEESKTAADKVNELVKNIQDKTKNAVKSMGMGTKVVAEGECLIEKTVSSINNISESTSNTSIMFHEIAAASEEQAVSNEEITASVRDVETIIEKSAKALQETSVGIKEQTALMEDILKATQELLMLANDLENDVVRFNLGGYNSRR